VVVDLQPRDYAVVALLSLGLILFMQADAKVRTTCASSIHE
jgi:hypothetical protein